jgi:hypothetical protein
MQWRWYFRCQIREYPSSMRSAASCVRNYPCGNSIPCTISDVDCIIITSLRLIASCSIDGNENNENGKKRRSESKSVLKIVGQRD